MSVRAVNCYFWNCEFQSPGLLSRLTITDACSITVPHWLFTTAPAWTPHVSEPPCHWNWKMRRLTSSLLRRAKAKRQHVVNPQCWRNRTSVNSAHFQNWYTKVFCLKCYKRSIDDCSISLNTVWFEPLFEIWRIDFQLVPKGNIINPATFISWIYFTQH